MHTFDYSTRLKGKTALVTGGGTGIGRAVATALARQGAQVAVCGRRREKLEETVEEAGANGSMLTIQADVSKKKDAARIVDEVIGRFKKLDVLVNNAGVFKANVPAHQTSDADWETVLEINLNGVFRLTRACLPRLIENGGGSIVNIASILGLIAMPNTSAYNASKGALIQFTRSLAVEYGKDRVRANCIAPGLVRTPMTQGLMSQKEALDEIAKGYPMGFFGEPEDIAHAAVYLASDEAKWVTGVVLPVDGGYTAA